VLHRAWARVRESGMASDSEAKKQGTRRFDPNWLAKLERIRDQLKKNKFSFTGVRGVALPKGKNKAERRRAAGCCADRYTPIVPDWCRIRPDLTGRL